MIPSSICQGVRVQFPVASTTRNRALLLTIRSGLTVGDPVRAMARLQFGRSCVRAGDTAKAKAAYQQFLNLWKDADPDVPVLKQAKAEYAKLQ